MEIGFGCKEKVGFLHTWFVGNVAGVPKKVKKIGLDDPRRIVHSLKVGLALTLVSLFYYSQPLYNSFGLAGIWAVLTVVVIFEYSVGATLSKGLNRAFATFLAGALAVGVQHLASLSGKRGEPFIQGASVFLLASASTFSRFFPGIKARYDYGVVIFILTFSLVAVSGYRVDELVEFAQQRLSTIAVGCFTCMFISICICPVWAGEDLQNSVALNIEKLANFLDGFGAEYFKEEVGENADVTKEDKTFLQEYKSVLNSKSYEDSLANFARWEPGHGQFKFRHPWTKYQQIGSLARQCACSMDALNACITSKTQLITLQATPEFRLKIQESCMNMSSESSKALTDLASAIRTMTKPTLATHHIARAKSAAADLMTPLKVTSSKINSLLEILPATTVASLLVEIVTRTEKIAEAVDELAAAAKFNNPPIVTERKPLHSAMTKQVSDDASKPHVLIIVQGSSSHSPENTNSKETVKSNYVEV